MKYIIFLLVVTNIYAKTITVINNCDQVIRLGHTGGFIRSILSRSECLEQNKHWDPRRSGCFYKFDDGYQFLERNQEAELFIEDIWSGHIWASTGCSEIDGVVKCETGVCGTSTSACTPSVGPTGPVTKAEFTFNVDGVDWYDVSIIDGVNLPIEILPLDSRCKTVGNVDECNWQFDPSIENEDLEGDLRFVTTETDITSCRVNNDCPLEQVCGKNRNLQNYVCGFPLGWWSAVSSCASHVTTNISPFFCSQYTLQGDALTNGDLYGCSDNDGKHYTQSGYNIHLPQDVDEENICGCVEWSSYLNMNVNTAHSCAHINPVWTERALPFCGFLKKACKNAYTYAYDDATSLWTCTDKDTSFNGKNNVDYIFTFCPQNSEEHMLFSNKQQHQTYTPTPSPTTPSPTTPSTHICEKYGSCKVLQCMFDDKCLLQGGMGCIAYTPCRYCGFSIFPQCS